jgi:NAD(P)H-hydrate repair Nnr-like enzyme with NAD(P)H-hydrate epimerase domain/8-oxo-dGTP pyrophosphatase MutT (NUDIX family)
VTDPLVARLTRALSGLPPGSLTSPEVERLGATLVLIEPTAGGDATIVYTRRRDDLRSHPGQISFPGGRVDPGETVEQAAVREAHEEVALDPGAVELLGRLPAFYIPPSRFWLQAVLAHWVRPHPLVASEAEVAAVLHVPLSRLHDPASWRTVRLSAAGWSWAWDLGDGHLLWGATAILTTVVLSLLDPHWNGGANPAEMADREVRPWEGEGRVVDRVQQARLGDLPEESAEDHAATEPVAAAVTDERVERAAAEIVTAAATLASGRLGPVMVLAGSGGTGRVGVQAGEVLAARGLEVAVVRPGEEVSDLPRAAVIIDALVGSGLHGALRGPALDLIHHLRLRSAPVVSVDLPSGLDPVDGLVGDCVSADVTVAIGSTAPGLLLPGLAPFVGDLYLAALAEHHPGLVRLVGARAAPTWRE